MQPAGSSLGTPALDASNKAAKKLGYPCLHNMTVCLSKMHMSAPCGLKANWLSVVVTNGTMQDNMQCSNNLELIAGREMSL